MLLFQAEIKYSFDLDEQVDISVEEARKIDIYQDEYDLSKIRELIDEDRGKYRSKRLESVFAGLSLTMFVLGGGLMMVVFLPDKDGDQLKKPRAGDYNGIILGSGIACCVAGVVFCSSIKVISSVSNFYNKRESLIELIDVLQKAKSTLSARCRVSNLYNVSVSLEYKLLDSLNNHIDGRDFKGNRPYASISLGPKTMKYNSYLFLVKEADNKSELMDLCYIDSLHVDTCKMYFAVIKSGYYVEKNKVLFNRGRFSREFFYKSLENLAMVESLIPCLYDSEDWIAFNWPGDLQLYNLGCYLPKDSHLLFDGISLLKTRSLLNDIQISPNDSFGVFYRLELNNVEDRALCYFNRGNDRDGGYQFFPVKCYKDFCFHRDDYSVPSFCEIFNSMPKDFVSESDIMLCNEEPICTLHKLEGELESKYVFDGSYQHAKELFGINH